MVDFYIFLYSFESARNLIGSSDFMSKQLSVSDPVPKDSFRQTSSLAQRYFSSWHQWIFWGSFYGFTTQEAYPFSRELTGSQSVVYTCQTSITWDPFNKVGIVQVFFNFINDQNSGFLYIFACFTIMCSLLQRYHLQCYHTNIKILHHSSYFKFCCETLSMP